MLNIKDQIKHSLDKLEVYLDASDLKGYDPYDALNSKILTKLSFNRKLLKIIYTQALKKLPINLRPLLFIKKEYNPKGLGLFLTGYLKLYSLYKNEKYLKKIDMVISILDKIKSKGYSGYCWGYNFNWQSKAHYTPSGMPTIVNTVFIAHAFLDAYKLLGEKCYLDIARSACDFILNDLNISGNDNHICFSYTPLDTFKVNNASMLGAGILARMYYITREDKLLEFAQKATAYISSKQNPDGSWYYAETNYQRWIDCHHTGFVLESLFNYMKYTGDKTYLANLEKGFKFLKTHFILPNGMTKFYHNCTYPVDIHCPSQAIVTLVKLKEISESSQLLQKVACWMVDYMQDKTGYFYYRKERFFYNKIPYVRWAQAWAFHALTTYYLYLEREKR
jgi:rhamnogalacturonyl hydrolase YesR